MKTLAPIASAIVCCALAVPAAAAAKVIQTPTQVAVTGSDSQTLHAVVSSRSKRCVRERTVGVYPLSGDVAFLTKTTTRAGSFSIALNEIPPGSSGFRVRAEPVRVGNRQCEAGSFDVEADFVTLDGAPRDGAFSGVLFSSVEACEPGRLISLYEISSEPVFAGSDTADSNGAWQIAQATGTWQVRADAQFVEAGGVVTLCSAVASQPWTFEEPAPE